MLCSPFPSVRELREAGTWTVSHCPHEAEWPHNTVLMFSLTSVWPNQTRWHFTAWSHSEPSLAHQKHWVGVGGLSTRQMAGNKSLY